MDNEYGEAREGEQCLTRCHKTIMQSVTTDSYQQIKLGGVPSLGFQIQLGVCRSGAARHRQKFMFWKGGLFMNAGSESFERMHSADKPSVGKVIADGHHLQAVSFNMFGNAAEGLHWPNGVLFDPSAPAILAHLNESWAINIETQIGYNR